MLAKITAKNPLTLPRDVASARGAEGKPRK
jgi:hypothetical protein